MFCVGVKDENSFLCPSVFNVYAIVSSRSPIESVSAGFLLLHGGDGGEAEPAESHRDQSSRLKA